MRIHHGRMDRPVAPDSSTSRGTCSLLQGCRNECGLSVGAMCNLESRNGVLITALESESTASTQCGTQGGTSWPGRHFLWKVRGNFAWADSNRLTVVLRGQRVIG